MSHFEPLNDRAEKMPSTARLIIFSFGVLAVFLCVGVLIGTYTREVKSTDYLQQTRDAFPWILWGISSACLGTILCSFGKGIYRTLGVWSGAILVIVWLMPAGSAV